MLFIQRLRQAERVLGGKAEAAHWLRAAGWSGRTAAGAICVDGFDSSVTVPVLPRQAATIDSAAALLHSRSARFSGSVSSFLNFGVEPAAFVDARRGARTRRALPSSRAARSFLIFSSRSTTIDSVGVCTRPTVVR